MKIVKLLIVDSR